MDELYLISSVLGFLALNAIGYHLRPTCARPDRAPPVQPERPLRRR